MAEPCTQVLVLGSVPLSGMAKTFNQASFEPVVDKLAAFKPDVITIEAISSEQCDLAARHPSVYGADLGGYCADPAAAKAATRLDVPAAIKQVRATLKIWAGTPTAGQRRHLASLFLAANDRASTIVQCCSLQRPSAELATVSTTHRWRSSPRR